MNRTRPTRRGRAAARATERDTRREHLAVLLSRADRGVLNRDEAGLLRLSVEAEITEGDTARRSAGGQQAAARRLLFRIEAAEQALVEAEAEAEALRQHLAGLESRTEGMSR